MIRWARRNSPAVTASFLTAISSAFAVLMFLFRNDPIRFGNTETLILIVGVGIVYLTYAVVRRTSRSQLDDKDVLYDIIKSVGHALQCVTGNEFRISVMKPNPPVKGSPITFGFVVFYNMTHLSQFRGKVTEATPGVGSAYRNDHVVHLGPTTVDSTIDAWPKNLWSVGIGKISPGRAILTIMTDEPSYLAGSKKDAVNILIKTLAESLSDYQPHHLTNQRT